MAKGVSNELAKLREKILRDVIDTPPQEDYPMPKDAIGQALDIWVIEGLFVEGALIHGTASKPGQAGEQRVLEYVKVTRYGREYYEELSTPTQLYWLRRNWFPASIALITIAVSIAGIVRG